MKKFLGCFLCALLVLALFPMSIFAANVVLSPQKLSVDGKDVACEKYNIDGSNYFKLRDLAYLLNGTSSQFEVGWDSASSTVSITTGKPYSPNGSELVVGSDKSSSAQKSTQTIIINGIVQSGLSVYNLAGNNFFKLRDLGDVLGFSVDYDESSNTAMVYSSNIGNNSSVPKSATVEYLGEVKTMQTIEIDGVPYDNGITFNRVFQFSVDGETDFYIMSCDVDSFFDLAIENYNLKSQENPFKNKKLYPKKPATNFTETTEYLSATEERTLFELTYNKKVFAFDDPITENGYGKGENLSVSFIDGVETTTYWGRRYINYQDLLDYFGIQTSVCFDYENGIISISTK